MIYFDAREPAVILSDRAWPLVLDIGVLNSAFPLPTSGLGVILPVELEGVTRPPAEGVIRPFEKERDGVRDAEIRDREGVTLPELLGLALAALCVP